MKQHTHRRQTGFTMIELIVVIVILGILAATALPRFLNVQDEAKKKAVKGVAATMASAMQVNYSTCLVLNQKATADKCIAMTNCTDVKNVLQGGAVPTGYTVTSLSLGAADGNTAVCTVTDDSDAAVTATFNGVRAGNG